MRVKSAIANAAGPIAKRTRCAIYTRKSTDEGLQSDFNTLDAQRESALNYIRSQKDEGWEALPERFDDGGFTGGNMERPALKRLLAAIEAGEIDCVCVYKIDRLTRSLLDFSRIVEIFDRHNVSFVAVTQQFSTTSSLGRLTLHILLSFAQFERELISERTKDKMSAARRKGKWIGGQIPLGYDLAPNGGALVVNETEAKHVRAIYGLYLKHGSLIPVIQELDRKGWTMKAWTSRDGSPKGGARFTKTTLHNLLTSILYTGQVEFEGTIYPGEHARILDDEVWTQVQAQLKANRRTRGSTERTKSGALLSGIIRCGTCDCGMTHTFTQKATTRYRYYTCINAHQRGWNQCQTRSVSAPEIEQAVIAQVHQYARQPAMFQEVFKRLRQSQPTTTMVDPGHLEDALQQFDPLWCQLTNWEQDQLIRSLIAGVSYDGPTGSVSVVFRSDQIKTLCASGDAVA